MISSGPRHKWRLNDDAERSSIWSSLPASQYPGDLAQLRAKHFPARRRVITTFCSTKAPSPLAFLISSCLLPRPPLFLCGHPLPSAFLLSSRAPQAIHTLTDLFLCPVITTLRHRQAMNGERVCLLANRQQQKRVKLWIIHKHAIQTIITAQKWMEIKRCFKVNHRRSTERQADGSDARTGYHPAGEERRPTRFSAKARCTRDPDGQRCPFQL